jgi:spore germination protein GerM
MSGRDDRAMARRRPAGSSPQRRRRWLAVFGLFAVVVGTLIALRAFRDGGDDLLDEIPTDAAVDPGQSVSDRAVTLVFPDRNADGFVNEQRRIATDGLPEAELLQVITELCAGPQTRRAISGLPRRTRPLAVFLIQERREAVLDFSSELVSQHPGGSAAEVATLTSILRTVALNFPALETCRILVDGAELQNLAGHHIADQPFALKGWL